jgi:hypothetical protein
MTEAGLLKVSDFWNPEATRKHLAHLEKLPRSFEHPP